MSGSNPEFSSSFSIGPQTAGKIYNNKGNQTINESGADATLASEFLLSQLRSALARTPLDARTERAVSTELDQLEEAVSGAAPNRERAASRLSRITAMLTGGGALAAAGSDLATSLADLAQWIGP
ncbi:hypothetical protein ACWEKT_40700 [Nocardia takedensis]|uniref:hypothetical protein n=1 Tax=Nocardia takedensis TaxID=259390 RepID=UPI0012F6F71B|nr:hypothetical protein [Nocardia takedensis]